MKIGLFDSGYGGLTVLEAVRKELPQYDFIYFGDNANAPYGGRSFEIIHSLTWRAVEFLFSCDCALVILACNTASARALRTIQQVQLPGIHKKETSLSFCRRVLGVIIPTVEAISEASHHVGILATDGTIRSNSYPLEMIKRNPNLHITQEACPLWVPLIETNEYCTEGGRFFIEKHIRNIYRKDKYLDTLILGCTHYPIMLNQILEVVEDLLNKGELRFKPEIIAQGEVVAKSLKNYLERHVEISSVLSQNGNCEFYTSETCEKFEESASTFIQFPIRAQQVKLK